MPPFGEAGILKIQNNGKMRNPSAITMYVGHADGRAGDVNRMWNDRTNKYSEARDIIWLNHIYFEETVKTTMRS